MTQALGVEDAVHELARIGASLVGSYERLAERAERVEHELCLANAELEHKVRELDETVRELDATKRHLEALLSALPTGVVERDAHGRIVSANDAALAILGCEATELAGRTEHPALEGEDARGEPRELTRPDGARLVLGSRYATVLDCDGRPTGSVEILDDRTEITALFERIHALDKMSALGTMAGGIAHEIRNPLHAVGGFAALLVRELPEGKARRWARRIVEGADEASAIVASMLTLAAPEKLALELVDPAELARDAVRAALPADESGASDARWRVTTSVDAPRFRGDRQKLRQALRNLVANAAQVQPEGGPVDVQVRRESDDLVLTVSDGGPGIPTELARRVLDPFYTSRAEGTGLGLALVDAIARLHGGAVTIHPERGPLGGATVSLRFPFLSET